MTRLIAPTLLALALSGCAGTRCGNYCSFMSGIEEYSEDHNPNPETRVLDHSIDVWDQNDHLVTTGKVYTNGDVDIHE